MGTHIPPTSTWFPKLGASAGFTNTQFVMARSCSQWEQHSEIKFTTKLKSKEVSDLRTAAGQLLARSEPIGFSSEV